MAPVIGTEAAEKIERAAGALDSIDGMVDELGEQVTEAASELSALLRRELTRSGVAV